MVFFLLIFNILDCTPKMTDFNANVINSDSLLTSCAGNADNLYSKHDIFEVSFVRKLLLTVWFLGIIL